MKLFIFGFGYTATRLVKKLSSTSWQYSGTHRNSHILFDGHAPVSNIAEHLNGVTHVLISIPPDRDQKDFVYHHHLNDLRNLSDLKWLGYLSTTSVYGNWSGQWVNEMSDTNPTEDRGKSRLAAEKLWIDSGLPTHIFRLGGIYGPGRNQIEAVKNNSALKIIKENHYFSRIHVNDISSALIKSMEQPSNGSVYNIVDDFPAPASDVLDFLCDKLGKPRLHGIPLEQADISPALRSFYADNKRVSNRITKEKLNWQPQFPSFKEGYLDILAKLN
jgi:nucleoside-diphosphate-sugar epimerase